MLPAIFVPVGLTLGVIAVLIVFDWASLTGLTFSGGMLVDARFTLMLGKHTQSIPFFALNLTVSYLWACLVGCIFTIGEEFGWQGYLNQKLLSRFGLNWGLILLGIIWGYWHMPIILMGYNFPTHPILGALVLMPIGTIFLGIFQAWLYLRSRSIWMPVLFHASGNAAAGFLFGGMTMHQGQDEILMALLWIAGWGIVAAFSLVALNVRQPKLWQEGGEPVVGSPAQVQEPVLEV
jgi:membrane protease YdiL (CAAX protease family)